MYTYAEWSGGKGRLIQNSITVVRDPYNVAAINVSFLQINYRYLP